MRGALEHLDVVPGDVDQVDRRLSGPRGQQRLPGEPVDRPPGIAPGNAQRGHADAAVFGDTENPQIKQGVMQRAERQRIGHLVRPVLAVPAHVRRLDRNRSTAQLTIEAAHGALVRVRE
jgi:hypothetical protein